MSGLLHILTQGLNYHLVHRGCSVTAGEQLYTSHNFHVSTSPRSPITSPHQSDRLLVRKRYHSVIICGGFVLWCFLFVCCSFRVALRSWTGGVSPHRSCWHKHTWLAISACWKALVFTLPAARWCCLYLGTWPLPGHTSLRVFLCLSLCI